MKKFLSLILPLLLLAGCAKENSDQPEQPERRYLVQAEAASTMPKELVRFFLNASGFGQYAELMQSDVRMLRVVYATEYPKGTKINVSGALFISGSYSARFPTVVYNHGTYSDRNSAPSLEIQATPPSMEVVLGAAVASAFGCAVLIPDYVGYGESKNTTHPYMHGESLGQTGLDFIRAYREYAADPAAGLSFNSSIFITGYSEGGYAAVALHKAVDDHPEEELTVLKTVAGSGAYDMVAFSKEIIDNPNPLGSQMLSSYLWVIGMYKTDFRYSKGYADIFSEADNALLQSIGYDLAYFRNAAESLPLHDISSQLFRPEFIAGIRDETDTEFIGVSRQNSLTDFAPKDSLIFVYGDADEWVYPVNSVNAYHAMLAKGCKVRAYVQPNGTHSTTLPLYVEVLLARLAAVEHSDVLCSTI
ncbi:MAG: lipase family protein [Prevotellaceae bacterium]|jgi:dienelactone hydrolase|nr:lipase family protein [Prevotellaceae bacterium]